MASLFASSRIALRSINRHTRFRHALVRWESSISQRPGSDTYVFHPHTLQKYPLICVHLLSRVRFPGAVDSKFTSEMGFSRPSSLPAMPTYRVMDSDGVIVDTKHEPSDVSIEEVITWYKNMLTGMSFASRVVEIDTLIGSSQYHGCYHVRGAETGSSEFLHGMVGP